MNTTTIEAVKGSREMKITMSSEGADRLWDMVEEHVSEYCDGEDLEDAKVCLRMLGVAIAMSR